MVKKGKSRANLTKAASHYWPLFLLASKSVVITIFAYTYTFVAWPSLPAQSSWWTGLLNVPVKFSNFQIISSFRPCNIFGFTFAWAINRNYQFNFLAFIHWLAIRPNVEVFSWYFLLDNTLWSYTTNIGCRPQTFFKGWLIFSIRDEASCYWKIEAKKNFQN